MNLESDDLLCYVPFVVHYYWILNVRVYYGSFTDFLHTQFLITQQPPQQTNCINLKKKLKNLIVLFNLEMEISEC